MDQEQEAIVVKSPVPIELNCRVETEKFGSWMVISCQSRRLTLSENRKIKEEKGNHRMVEVEENWDLNIMVAEGESMSNKSGLKFLEGGPSSSVLPEPSTVKWGKFKYQNHHGLRNKKKVDAMIGLNRVVTMMPMVDLVEHISEQIDSAIRNIEVQREDGMDFLEAEGEEGNFQTKC
ncbi:hypothetical protein PVK06_040467 [Gossypium arboreum]|uniref:Uncharacterized protein n=1 Tax=Gossypium arboreum TaxID=29729 RepID=A0ABR0N5J5_GOSAR|nr:hypothetical protein PVK06_040467 [Gossypium arboreum]